jgi:AcrR family transcriptional regulator
MWEVLTVAGAAKKRTRRRLSVEQRREELLQIGLERFERTPYEEISIEQIAEEAGISKGLIYHYFPSKRDYYVAALGVAAGDLVARIEAVGDDAARAFEAYLSFVEEREPAYRALYRGGIGFDQEVSAIVESCREQILESIIQHAGNVTPPVRNALRGFIGYVEASVLDWLDHRDMPREHLLTSWQNTLMLSVQLATEC